MAVTAPAPRVLADVLPRSAARDALLIIGAACFVGLAAQISIPLPFTPVPLTAQTFAVLLAGAALGSIRGILSMLLYAVVGLIGVPWFAEGSSGFSMPSFGYIVGFIAGAGLVGWLAERGWTRTPIDMALAMVLGNVVVYAIGVPWLKVAMGTTWAGAVQMGMTPFLIGDGLKIALAAGIFPLVWRTLSRRGLAPRADGGESVIDLTDGTAERSDDSSSETASDKS
ncbi:MAG: biotin transporter BioY [Candidatus Nanopelagicales bacterium]